MAVVSVITPSFNRSDLYGETLASLKAQTFADWENIVVDDGSSEECLAEMNGLVSEEPRVTLLSRDREPKGACVCRNIGVERCTGEYVIFLDTDDLLEAHCLQQRIDVMRRNPELDLAFFACRMFEKVPGDLGLWWNIDTGEDLLERQFRQDAIAQGTGVIWTRAAFERIGMWDEHLAIWQDIDLFLRTFIEDYKYKICFDLPSDLQYRQHNSLSRAGFYTRPKIESRCRVIKSAVSLMESKDRHHERGMARSMTAELIVHASRGRLFDVADDMLRWAVSHEVVSRPDSKVLSRAVLFFKSRLTRFQRVKTWAERPLSIFRSESKLGRVSVTEDLIQAASTLECT